MTNLSDFFYKQCSFNGRSGRTEYWVFFIVTGLISTVLDILGELFSLFTIISFIFALVILVPSLAIGVRRLHDLNLSGGWLVGIFVYTLLTVIAFVSIPTISALHPVFITIIILIPSIYLAFAPGKNEGNRFGLKD